LRILVLKNLFDPQAKQAGCPEGKPSHPIQVRRKERQTHQEHEVRDIRLSPE